MDILVIAIAALIASGLTLFSGFGLGTLLMPVVALFLPVELAISITAMVHLANNFFKVGLLGRQANRSVLLAFGVPAVAAAFIGALLLGWLADLPSLFDHQLFGDPVAVSPVKLTVGLLILGFVLLELSPRLASLAIDRKYLPVGGLVSGFFGGLSGHQGAFRSMFLIKAGLDKQQFVATGATLAVMVDMSRMLIYGWEMSTHSQQVDWPLVIAASLSAFAGAYLGARLLNKVTFKTVRLTVSALLLTVALGLISGLI